MGCLRGEAHPRAKFTDDQIREIRRRARAKERQAALAKELGCSQPCIQSIVTFRTWAHVR